MIRYDENYKAGDIPVKGPGMMSMLAFAGPSKLLRAVTPHFVGKSGKAKL